MKFPNISEKPIDYNDPAAAGSAMRIFAPASFGHRAKLALKYFDDSAFIFWYKNRIVLTDENLELTEYEGDITEQHLGPDVNQSPCRMYAGPRWVGSTMQELEEFLNGVTDDLDAEDPNWLERLF